jgi:hypothetical protein
MNEREHQQVALLVHILAASIDLKVKNGSQRTRSSSRFESQNTPQQESRNQIARLAKLMVKIMEKVTPLVAEGEHSTLMYLQLRTAPRILSKAQQNQQEISQQTYERTNKRALNQNKRTSEQRNLAV